MITYNVVAKLCYALGHHISLSMYLWAGNWLRFGLWFGIIIRRTILSSCHKHSAHLSHKNATARCLSLMTNLQKDKKSATCQTSYQHLL